MKIALIICIILLVIYSVLVTKKFFDLRNSIVVLSENLPKDLRKQSKAMKFSDELDKYIVKDNDKIYLKVLKVNKN